MMAIKGVACCAALMLLIPRTKTSEDASEKESSGWCYEEEAP